MIWILFGILTIFLLCFWTYAALFLTINDDKAWELAHGIITEKYESMCGGWFHENLTLQKNGYNAIYEFYADSKNKNCSVLIFMWKFGEYDSWIWAN